MCPSEYEWSQVSTITGYLKLFVDVATVFAESKHPTANIYFPEVCAFHLQLIDWCQSVDEDISSLALSNCFSFHGEYNSRSLNFGSPQFSERSTQSRPLKDFVCPITSHVFSDPVTPETGQT